MKRISSLLLSATLLAGALTTVAASPASACARAAGRKDVFRAMKNDQSLEAGVVKASAGMETVSLLTFNLDASKVKPVYNIGETVKIDVTVTRPAKEDPLGNGIPMDRPYYQVEPGVIVGIGLHIGRVFLPGAAITDDNGIAHVRIKIEDYAPKNTWVDSSMYAWRTVQETTCATIQEYGYASAPHHFKTGS
ncbi:MAG: hypothetical protein QOG16_39 [Actinomycetota bacterium]|jgi:uncharacterized membrane protein|nr:hypothetical protein [Actinomycetota bacterium]